MEDFAVVAQAQSSASLVYVSVVDPTGIGAQSGLDLLGDARLQEQLAEAFQRGQHGTAMISVPVVSESLQEPVVVSASRSPSGAASRASSSPSRACSRSATITTAERRRRLFEVYVVDNRGSADRALRPRPAARGRRLRGRDRAPLPAATPRTRAAGTAARQRRSGTGGTTRFDITDDRRSTRGTCSAPTCACPDDSGWGVIVQVDVDKAYFTAIDLRNKSLLLVAVVTALAVVLGSLFAGQISRPVQKLADGARRLAGGDYAHPGERCAAATRSGVLADAFNQMGEEIEKAIEEIQAPRPRRTRSSSWAPSACWRTPSTRRTPTPAATPSASPTTRPASPSTSG